MASTYGPEATFDVPSGSDYAQQLADDLQLSTHHVVDFLTARPSDEHRKMIEGAIREATADSVVFDDMEVVKISRDGARMEITVRFEEGEDDAE